MLEETAAASESPKIFQLYIRGDWAWVTGMIDRIKAAGYQGFCLTVDSALYSRRERPMISRWSVDTTRAPQNREWQAKVTWDDVVRMRDYAGLPFVLKGIMSPEDAALAVQHGVDAVWVSNQADANWTTARAPWTCSRKSLTWWGTPPRWWWIAVFCEALT